MIWCLVIQVEGPVNMSTSSFAATEAARHTLSATARFPGEGDAGEL